MQIDYKWKEWDSSFFNIKIGEALLTEFDTRDFSELKRIFALDNFRLVYLNTNDQKSFESLHELGVPLFDNKFTFFKKIDSYLKICLEEIQPYTYDEHYSKLLDLAITSGEHSRFKLDQNFKTNDFKDLYTAWIKNSLNKQIADEIIVWRNMNGEILGFITYKIRGIILKIGLFAVDDNSKGKGIGKNLLKYIENIAFINKVSEIIIETQEKNILACDFYARMGYKKKKNQPIFHLWISK